MDKRIQLLCACLLVMGVSGCSNDACQGDACSAKDLATEPQALKTRNFEVKGGAPWSKVEEWAPLLSNANQKYGHKLVKGKFYYGEQDDIVAGYYTWPDANIGNKISQVEFRVVQRDGGLGTLYPIEHKDNETNVTASFGYDLAAGPYCRNLTYNGKALETDLLIVSMPTESHEKCANCGGVAMYGMFTNTNGHGKSFKPLLSLYGTKTRDFAGDVIAVGDVNGDHEPDLVYRSTAVTESFNYDSISVKVHLNMCKPDGCTNKTDCTLRDDMVLIAPHYNKDYDFKFGEKIYIKDLDGKGQNEIILVASEYNPDELAIPPGAVFFYKYVEGAKSLVESRPMLVGGGGLSTLEFMDVDGDGDLDILAGEPLNDDAHTGGKVVSYTNTGAGKSFTAEGRKVELSVNVRRSRFGGGDIVLDDLNHDDVPDLIVGAPGVRSDSFARIYVFLGTKDGSVFSKLPYWTYNYSEGEAGASQRSNGALGMSIVTTELTNNTGWKDIVVSAPDTPNPANKNMDMVGSIRIITSATKPCYTADKCLLYSIDEAGNYSEACYEAGDVNPDNACELCDPSKANFGWQPVTCEGTATDCAEAPVCDVKEGCIAKPLPDDTECGTQACQNASVSRHHCVSGECVEKKEDCGDYLCASSSGVPACLTSCTTQAQCANADAVCKSGQCVINTPPEIKALGMENTFYPGRVKPGETMTVFVKATDADGDILKYSWTDDGASVGKFANANAERTDYTVLDSTLPGNYNFVVTVCDDFTCVSSNKLKFEVYVDPVNHAPIVAMDPERIEGRRGEAFGILAEAKDEDDDPLTYNWYVSDPVYGSFFDNGKAENTFTIGDGVDDDTTFYVNVSVSDGKAATEGRILVKVLPDIVIPPPVFVYPEANATVETTFEVVGAVAAEERDDDYVFLYDENMNRLCMSDVVAGRWSCNVKLEGLGEHMLMATYQVGEDTSQPTYHFIIVSETPVSVPVITYPEDGEVTSSRIVVEGTIEESEGSVYVWDKLSEQQLILICMANISSDNTWRCASNKDLSLGEHTIVANWINGDITSDWSNAVNITVDVPDSSLAITSMKDGNVIDTYNGLIVAGTATSGDLVTASILWPDAEFDDRVIAQCTAYTDTAGHWSCIMPWNSKSDETGLLLNAVYEATASTEHEGNETTVSLTFTVENKVPDKTPGAHTATGGSCSMTLNPPASTPWWFAIAAFFGIVLIPLRRREK